MTRAGLDTGVTRLEGSVIFVSEYVQHNLYFSSVFGFFQQIIFSVVDSEPG